MRGHTKDTAATVETPGLRFVDQCGFLDVGSTSLSSTIGRETSEEKYLYEFNLC